MTTQEIQKLLTQCKHATIAMNRPSRSPQVTPVWYIWEGEALYFSTKTSRATYRHIKHDPSISLIVYDGSDFAAASGQAHIIDQDFADLVSRIVVRYVPPERREAWMKLLLEPDRVIIKLQPEQWTTS